MTETIEALNVNLPGHREKLNKQKYQIIKEAMLKVIPTKKENENGLTVNTVIEEVYSMIKTTKDFEKMFPKGLGSVMWYVKAVQLDLEARNIIARLPKVSPLRLVKL